MDIWRRHRDLEPDQRAGPRRQFDRRAGGVHFLRGVADQGRQQNGRAKAAMRRDDRGDAFDARRVVEQDVAAAVYLHVNKTRREPRAIGKMPDREFRREFADRHNADDSAAIDKYGVIAVNRRPVEHEIGGDRVPFGGFHRVGVIVCG